MNSLNLIKLIVITMITSILVTNISDQLNINFKIAFAEDKNAQINSQSKTIESISTESGYEMIRKNAGNPEFEILDVRTPGEYADGHINNALNLDFTATSFRDSLEKLDRNKTYMVYCRTGNRSSQAVNIMDELGFKKVYHLGGIVDWEKMGYPIVK